MAYPSQPFAGIGVTDARQEEACAKRQHDNVQHGMFLCEMNRGPNGRLALDGSSATGRIGFRDEGNGDVIGIS
jgi:hypothetical protein